MDRTPVIARILAEQLGVEQNAITSESNLEADLGTDSLDVVELAMAFEEEYDITIADDEMAECKTVADIATLIENKIG